MARTADVVVIGGGITGASVAFHLCTAGVRRVVVLERGRSGDGSTGRAMGGARAQFADPLHIRMSLHSIAVFERFEEITGCGAGYLPHGYLLLATSAAHLERLAQIGSVQRAEGLTDVEMLSTAEVARRLPFLRTDDVLGAAFRQRDGFVDPLAVMRGFASAAARMGARLLERSPVWAVRVSGGRVVGVNTEGGRIDAPCVVNAAGPWAAEIARMAGVDLPVRPLRRQIARTGPIALLPPDTPMVIDLTDGFHLRPDPRGDRTPGLRIAGPDPVEAYGLDFRADPAFGDAAAAWLGRRAPELARAAGGTPRCSAGLYAVSPDHHAILGEEPGVRGFYEANGFSGHGVMHAPATGRILAELVTAGRSETFPGADALSPSRFLAGELLHEPAVF